MFDTGDMSFQFVSGDLRRGEREQERKIERNFLDEHGRDTSPSPSAEVLLDVDVRGREEAR